MNAKIALLKFIDRVIGPTAVRLLPRPVLPPLREVRSLLLIRPGGIGDAVHLLPLLQRLQEHFPAAAITILAEKRNAPLFRLAPGRITLCSYDRPGEFLALLRRRYDVVIDSEQWHYTSALVARLVRAPLKIGFASNGRRLCFTHSLPYDQQSYEAELFLSLLTPLGLSLAPLPPPPWLAGTVAGEGEVAALAVKIPRRYIVLFPGASIAARRWGSERFRALAQALRAAGREVVVVGGKEDRSAGGVICAGGVGLDLTGRTTLAGTAALLAGADLLVSGDSGILHLGVALGLSTVSLFGPGIAQKWGPRPGRHTLLNLYLSCSPCTLFGTTPPCPREGLCLSGLSVETVFNAVKKQLAENGNDS